VYLLVFHAYINEMHSSRSKIPSKKSRPYIYIKFLALLGAPYIYDISRLRVNVLLYSLFLSFLHGKMLGTLPILLHSILWGGEKHAAQSVSQFTASVV
jgi:hypothetical protein